MQKLFITGKKFLTGSISISGSKNATLPILAATILGQNIILKNVPLVKDVFTMIDLLSYIGLKIKINKTKNSIKVINKQKILNTIAPYKLVKTMRAGILVLGPLLAKYKKAKVSLPGGCAIGSRPVNLHLYALKKLGAKIQIKNGYIYASAKNGLTGCKIRFPSISVGATEHAIIAASYADGRTVLTNCAIEPEIKDLILFLNKLGFKISFKKRKIIVDGTQNTRSLVHSIMFDRIELGTYVIAAALSGNKITLLKVKPKVINTEIKILKKMGVKMKVEKSKITVFKSTNIKKAVIKTSPYPGFPTDLQAQIMVLMTRAKGLSKIKENIFENRFMHVPELRRMGAKIQIKNNTANIFGPSNLSGAEVMATDLRASVCLVLAGLIAENRTAVNRIYHLDRGYENLEKKLKNCKAIIKRA